MTLTPEEIEMIERDCREIITNELIFLDEYLYGDLQKIVNKLIKEVYVTAATKYLLQLKEERERAGKLREALELAKEYFDDKADCDYQGDPLEPVPNNEMKLLSEIQNSLNDYNWQKG